MANDNKWQDLQKKYLGTGNSQNNVNQTPYDDDTATQLREGNYKGYFNRAMQLNNLRKLSQKYLGNTQRNLGIDQSGEASSQNIQLDNNITSQYLNLANNYDTAERQITSDAINRYNENAAQDDQMLVNTIQNDPNNIDEYLQKAGYKDANGNYTEAYNGLSDTRKRYLDLALTGVQNTMMGNRYDADALGQVSIEGGYGGDKNIARQYKQEYNNMISYVNENGLSANNTAFRLMNDKGNSIYVLYKGGKYQLISREEFANFKGTRKQSAYGTFFKGKVTDFITW